MKINYNLAMDEYTVYEVRFSEPVCLKYKGYEWDTKKGEYVLQETKCVDKVFMFYSKETAEKLIEMNKDKLVSCKTLKTEEGPSLLDYNWNAIKGLYY